MPDTATDDGLASAALSGFGNFVTVAPSKQSLMLTAGAETRESMAPHQPPAPLVQGGEPETRGIARSHRRV